MSITIHMLAGSLIAISIKSPFLAVPLAYASHFAMDAVPHFGYPGGTDFKSAVKIAAKHKLTYVYSFITAVTLLAVSVSLVVTKNYYALLLGLVALFPDAFMTLYHFLVERNGRKIDNFFTRLNLKFHGKIQYERPWGIWIELVVFVMLSYVLFQNI